MFGEERARLLAQRARLREAPDDLGTRRRFAESLERQGLDGAALMQWHTLFGAYRGLGMQRHAVAVCRNALRLRPRHVHWRVRLACCLLAQGLRAEAAEHLHVAMDQAVHPVDIRVTRQLWKLMCPVRTLAA